ncbi:iron-containing redox enzyme family protein [Streptomyces sp. NPDC002790]|uniref:iron-containing redox enzyme family protein n=1 Tax=Streptomyces sp. NPDC002790 TaxID=3154431 RepID=UPI0033343AD6
MTLTNDRGAAVPAPGPTAERAPELPPPRGPLSAAVLAYLRGARHPLPGPEAIAAAPPLGDDVQLALYLCYELHYRGFAEVPDTLEWDPDLLRVRGGLEQHMLADLRAHATRHAHAHDALDELLMEPADGEGLSHLLSEKGELWQLREYAAHRSIYHLKEADPHAWVLPRLHGRPKAGMAAIEFDEFGGGRADRIHARLFADLMADLGLVTDYGHYLDAASAEALALVNQMSLFGLHRSLRGALVGHFATVETTSSPGSRRLAHALRRVGAGERAVFFYDEHVEADAVHEQVVRHEVVDGLLAQDPGLDADIAFGVDATGYLEDRFGGTLWAAWEAGESSLRTVSSLRAVSPSHLGSPA